MVCVSPSCSVCAELIQGGSGCLTLGTRGQISCALCTYTHAAEQLLTYSACGLQMVPSLRAGCALQLSGLQQCILQSLCEYILPGKYQKKQ